MPGYTVNHQCDGEEGSCTNDILTEDSPTDEKPERKKFDESEFYSRSTSGLLEE